jgi:hypothetical protein
MFMTCARPVFVPLSVACVGVVTTRVNGDDDERDEDEAEDGREDDDEEEDEEE